MLDELNTPDSLSAGRAQLAEGVVRLLKQVSGLTDAVSKLLSDLNTELGSAALDQRDRLVQSDYLLSALCWNRVYKNLGVTMLPDELSSSQMKLIFQRAKAFDVFASKDGLTLWLRDGIDVIRGRVNELRGQCIQLALSWYCLICVGRQVHYSALHAIVLSLAKTSEASSLVLALLDVSCRKLLRLSFDFEQALCAVRIVELLFRVTGTNSDLLVGLKQAPWFEEAKKSLVVAALISWLDVEQSASKPTLAEAVRAEGSKRNANMAYGEDAWLIADEGQLILVDAYATIFLVTKLHLEFSSDLRAFVFVVHSDKAGARDQRLPLTVWNRHDRHRWIELNYPSLLAACTEREMLQL